MQSLFKITHTEMSQVFLLISFCWSFLIPISIGDSFTSVSWFDFRCSHEASSWFVWVFKPVFVCVNNVFDIHIEVYVLPTTKTDAKALLTITLFIVYTKFPVCGRNVGQHLQHAVNSLGYNPRVIFNLTLNFALNP